MNYNKFLGVHKFKNENVCPHLHTLISFQAYVYISYAELKKIMILKNVLTILPTE